MLFKFFRGTYIYLLECREEVKGVFSMVSLFLLGSVIGAFAMRVIDVRSFRNKKKKIFIDTYAKMAVTVLIVHGMILTTWSYILASHGLDPVVDVSSTIVREIVAPVITYLATNTVMNIFEKNKLSFSVPINSTVIKKDGTRHAPSDDVAQG